jgi:hypothetical protein
MGTSETAVSTESLARGYSISSRSYASVISSMATSVPFIVAGRMIAATSLSACCPGS